MRWPIEGIQRQRLGNKASLVSPLMVVWHVTIRQSECESRPHQIRIKENMKTIKLEFRALLPDGTWFYQRNQYLRSFLRRVYAFWGISHDVQLKGEVEDKLQIRINEKWVQCQQPDFFKGEKE